MKNKGVIGAILGIFLLSSLQVSATGEVNHYVKSAWDGGYCYKFEVTNTGEDELDWTMKFDVDTDIRNSWSGEFSRTPTGYEVIGVSFNKIIKPGRTKTLGYCIESTVLPSNIELLDNNSSDTVHFENTFTENWISDWVLESARQWGFENLSLLSGDVLKVKYPEGSYKPSADPRGGAGFIKKFEADSDDIYLSFDVRFDSNFDFVKGGKLPGLCGGSCPTGGTERDQGFSTRFMWRTDGATEIYAYIADRIDGAGTSLGRGAATMVPSQWYTLTQRVKLNTIGQADGIIEYFVDGELVYSNTSVEITNNPDVKIDAILFATFFGGSDETWATPVTTYSFFKNFKVWSK